MKTTLLTLLLCVFIYDVNKTDAKVAHIIGPGTVDAEAGEFPYIVYIQQKSEFAVPKFLTTGILIRPAVVLTLARNFVDYRPEDIEVVFGTHNRSDGSDISGYREVIDVAEIVLHPDFTADATNPNTAKDLSLMRLVSTPVGVACSSGKKALGIRNLPMTTEEDLPLWSNMANCESAGFGVIKNTEFEVIYPTILQKYNVSVLMPSKALKELKKENVVGKDLWLVSKNEDLTSICVGDGGNPLLCSREYGGPYKVFGLASVGLGSPNCGAGITGWTRLSIHYGWIKKTSRKLQLNAGPSKCL